jgi:glucose/arabinose dehydrogenase
MKKYFSTLYAVAFAATASVPPALAQSVQLQTNIVATGLNAPLFAAAPEGDSRLFIVEKGGLIKVLQDSAVLPTPFLDLSNSVNTEGERGLVGMAFDPNFASNHRFYVNYIDSTSHDTVVATYQIDPARPNVADVASRQTVITLDQREGSTVHKAGWMGFRPGEPSNLYIATGDGSNSTNAQNLSSNLGKILRVDVSSDRFPGDSSQYGYTIPEGNLDTGNPEIYAYGLRNPFRNSFDRETGTFYIADVGRDDREEINIGAAGANYGWRRFEGTLEIFPDDAPIENHTPPIHEYSHTAFGGSVIGGYVYRGSEIPGLEGTYFFADFQNDNVMSFRLTDSGITDLTDRTAELLSPTGISGNISSFGEDGSGNLYLVSLSGQVGMITAIPEPESYAMMLAGIALIGIWVRQRRKASDLVV